MNNWVSALKLWNGDNRQVNTKNVWGVPRKGTKDYDTVKDIMEGKSIPKKRKVVIKRKTEVAEVSKPIVKEVINVRAEQKAPKEIVNAKIVTKQLVIPKKTSKEKEDEKELNMINKAVKDDAYYKSLPKMDQFIVVARILSMEISNKSMFEKLKPITAKSLIDDMIQERKRLAMYDDL